MRLLYLKMEKSKAHIRHCMLYEYQLGNSAAQATRNICRAISEGAVSQMTVSSWFNRFRNGDYTLEDQHRSGRPQEINLDELKQVIDDDPGLSTSNVASKLSCAKSTIHYHFRKFRLIPKLGEWIPRDLTDNQRKNRVEFCHKLKSLHRTFHWLDNLITGDEKWVLYTHPTRKYKWLKPGQQAKPTPKAGLHPEKRMLCIWWGIRGVIHWELLPKKATMTARLYSAQLSRVADAAEKLGLDMSKIHIQHDNAKPHVADLVKRKLKALNWEVLPHPPYSPDLAPSDYHLFLSLSNSLRGRNFQNEETLNQHLDQFFKSKPPEFYAKGIHDLPVRWQEVIDSNGSDIFRH